MTKPELENSIRVNANDIYTLYTQSEPLGFAEINPDAFSTKTKLTINIFSNPNGGYTVVQYADELLWRVFKDVYSISLLKLGSANESTIYGTKTKTHKNQAFYFDSNGRHVKDRNIVEAQVKESKTFYAIG